MGAVRGDGGEAEVLFGLATAGAVGTTMVGGVCGDGAAVLKDRDQADLPVARSSS